MRRRRRGLSRRDFLKSTASVAVGSALVPLVGCSGDSERVPDAGADLDAGVDAGRTDSGGDRDSGTDADAGTDAGPGEAVVGIARGDTVEDGVRRAVALTSGLGFIGKGDTVLLKPNMNSDDPYPYSTNPAVVAAVVTLALEAGAGRVVVGDQSNAAYDTVEAMRTTGVYDAAIGAGAEVMGFSDEDVVHVEPPGAVSWRNGWSIPTFVHQEVDHVINLPCVKHHFIANYSSALKNWVGVLARSDRSTCHADIGRRVPELHLATRESFVITDGTRACLSRGPFPGGAVAEPNLYVATSDPIANDVTVLAILKHYDSPEPVIRDFGVWDQEQIQHAISIGLGVRGPAGYRAFGDGVPELDEILAHVLG